MDFIIKYWIEFVLVGLTSGIAYAIKQYIGLKFGVQALIRNELVRIYETRTQEGYCPTYIKETVEDMYVNYHKLGGNGMVTKMVNKIYDLPNERKREK